MGGGEGGALEKLLANGTGGSILMPLGTGGGGSYLLLRSKLECFEDIVEVCGNGWTMRRESRFDSWLEAVTRELAHCVASMVELALPYLLYESLLYEEVSPKAPVTKRCCPVDADLTGDDCASSYFTGAMVFM